MKPLSSKIFQALFIIPLLICGRGALAETTVEEKLLEFKDVVEGVRYASANQPNYQVVNACLYSVYVEWEDRYMELLKNIPLDQSKISTLSIYSQFAASIYRDVHYLGATYPNLFQNVNFYIKQGRSTKSWPVGPQNISVGDIDNDDLGKNLSACFSTTISQDLVGAISQADLMAADKALKDVVSVTFNQTQKGGLEFKVDVNNPEKSNIDGVATGHGTDDFITPIPSKK